MPVADRRRNVTLAAVALIGLIGAASLAGCGEQRLESGYAYRPLNSSLVERRAFYVDPYSLEARRAEAEAGPDRSPAGGRPGGR